MFKAARVSLLVMLLACSVLAGDIQNGSSGPPQRATWDDSYTPSPQSNGGLQGPPADSGIPEGVAETLPEVALAVLNSVLALL